MLAAAALALVSGCSATNPQTTKLQYDPVDAAQADLGAVTIDSLMVVAADEDGPGALVARVVNRSTDAQSVTLTDDGPSGIDETFQVPAHSTLAVGPDQTRKVVVDPVGAPPGANLQMTAAISGRSPQRINVPVIGDALPEYQTLVPTPSASSAVPSTAPAASSTVTGGPSPTGGPASSAPVVTGAPTASPTGGGSASPSATPRTLSPSGNPTG